MKREVIGNEQIGTTSEHVFYTTDESKHLVVFFPGGNGTATGPQFYYIMDYCLRNGYDLLSLSYKGLYQEGDPYDVIMKDLTTKIQKAYSYVTEKNTYQKTVYVSRSFGNTVSTDLIVAYGNAVDHSIYISPTAPALPNIKTYPGLIITSDLDEYLKEEHINEILEYPDHEVLLFKGYDHGLECQDTMKNMDVCVKVITKVIEYIR